MSAAPEVRAAHAAGAACCLLALVVNRAAAVGSHEDVLAFGGRLAGALAAGLCGVVAARWPAWPDTGTEDASWTS
jgi:purine nucleoside phosphorylase